MAKLESRLARPLSPALALQERANREGRGLPRVSSALARAIPQGDRAVLPSLRGAARTRGAPMRSGERPGTPASKPLDGPRSNPTLSGPEKKAGVTPGVVFVLAAGGFLGYPPREIFWRDVLELVHEDDLPRAEAMISDVIDSPGASLSTELRFRDATGGWRLMDTSVQNVLEGPEDVGLVVVNVREAQPRAAGTWPPDGGR